MASPSQSSSINGFINQIQQGVKPNLFEVKFAAPAGAALASGLDQNLSMLCKAAAIPASNLGTIEVPFRGRTIKIAGDRTFDTWTATFINDKNFEIRQFFENWMRQINAHEGNTGQLYTPSSSASGYLADLEVRQLERNAAGASGASDVNEVIRRYYLKGAFPTNVSQIDLAYDSNDQIEDFTVEFQYQFWTVEAGSGARSTGTIA